MRRVRNVCFVLLLLSAFSSRVDAFGAFDDWFNQWSGYCEDFGYWNHDPQHFAATCLCPDNDPGCIVDFQDDARSACDDYCSQWAGVMWFDYYPQPDYYTEVGCWCYPIE